MLNFQVDLSGKTAIVAGAGDGIGQAVALALAASGASVTVNDLNPDRCERVAQQIREAGSAALPFQADISNRFQASALIERTRDQFGGVHILVNTVGAFLAREFSRVDEWDWRRQLDVNLTGAFFLTQLIGRVMSDEGGGVIIHLANTAYNATLAQGVGYVASKAGLVAMTRQAAKELAPANIRVNAVCPGEIEHNDLPILGDNFMQRPGTPQEVAHVVLFLCSDAAAFITGQAIHVDGGRI
ncbi:MAG: glucose 1-dehydrogenase [Phototrophicales bacterium]